MHVLHISSYVPCRNDLLWAQVSPVSLKRRGMATTEGCHLHRVRPHQAVKLTASPLATARAADVFCQGRRGRDQDGTSSYGNSTGKYWSSFWILGIYATWYDLFWPLDVGCDICDIWICDICYQCFANFYPHLIFCFGCCLVRPQQTQTSAPAGWMPSIAQSADFLTLRVLLLRINSAAMGLLGHFFHRKSQHGMKEEWGWFHAIYAMI